MKPQDCAAKICATIQSAISQALLEATGHTVPIVLPDVVVKTVALIIEEEVGGRAKRSTHPLVAQWVERDFRRQLYDKPQIVERAKAMMRVGYDRKESPETILRMVILSTVFDIAGVQPDQRQAGRN